jgi:branched-chain amino acid transport system ATP-binding protein
MHVTKSFESLRAVNGVSLEVKEGSLTGLIGPNGSGKSTLFNIVSGIEKADSGKIFFRGERIDGLSPHKIFGRGLVKSFQDSRLFVGMTVLDNVMIPAKNQLGEKLYNAPVRSTWTEQEIGLAKKAGKVLNSLTMKGLFKQSATEISGGQMKLLDVGRTLMGEPRMLLLDEPTAGVAPILAREIFQRILRMSKELGLTCFIIEHRLEILFEYADYIYVMHRGRILTEGNPSEILESDTVAEIYLGA